MSGSTCTGRRASPRRATAGRGSSRARRLGSSRRARATRASTRSRGSASPGGSFQSAPPTFPPRRRGGASNPPPSPPLTAVGHTNLPTVATAFVGRARELAEVTELICRDGTRLVTLTGPGGTGKTRLAIQSAGQLVERYPSGVWWVPLSGVRDPRLVLESFAQTLGTERPLADHIGAARMLVVFDNFEHVLDAAAGVAALQGRCPRLDVLVTSREPIHVAGEWEYRVDPLSEREAADLFVQRARAVQRDVELDGEVAAICRRLDCLPLAVELAAAHCKVLSPPELLERLVDRLPVLA